LNDRRQLQHQSTEETNRTGLATFESTKDAHPEATSAIGSNVDGQKLKPTKGDKHLHPNHQKGKENKPHIPSSRDDDVHGAAMEEPKDCLQIITKHGVVTYATAGDEKEARGPRR
jgi:hypothetical protein